MAKIWNYPWLPKNSASFDCQLIFSPLPLFPPPLGVLFAVTSLCPLCFCTQSGATISSALILVDEYSKCLIVSLFATLIFLVFYFQTVNLACTGIQFVHPVGTVLSDELFVSCDDSVTRMGKFVFWLAYSHYLGLGNNIT